jgi:hypothetical protein
LNYLDTSIFEKYSNIKFSGNPSSSNPVVPCGQKDGRTDMAKLKVAFRFFANAHKNGKAIPLQAWTGSDDSRSLTLPDFKTIGT